MRDDSGTDRASDDEPTVDEPGVDEPGVDEPTADEPATDEPTPENRAGNFYVGRSTGSISAEAIWGRLRRDPRAALPFAVVAVLAVVVDALRRWDPVPFTRPSWFADTLSIQYALFPRPTMRTSRSFAALVDLRLPVFLGAAALELGAVLAVAVAGWLTITRVADAERGVRGLLRYTGCVLALTLAVRLIAPVDVELGSLPLLLLGLAVGALFALRLFLFPGFLAAGHGVGSALIASVRTSRGRGSILVLVVVLGVAAGLLARVPVVGSGLTAAVALAHAVAVGQLVDAAESVRG